MTAPAHGANAAHDLSGTYVLTALNLTMTRVLRQDTQGALSGTLASTSDAQFQVDGRVQNGVGIQQGGAGRERLQGLVHHGPDRAQRVLLRDPLLRLDVAPQPPCPASGPRIRRLLAIRRL